jgi:two-component system, cell cycle response regulator DivK
MDDRKRHVLIVDDFKDNREMYEYFLTENGFRVTQASDGREAIEKASSLQPDVIVMDLSLPGMDGWETARQIKACEATRHIPVVILTAYDLPGAVPDGFEGFLTKPCLPERMISEITQVLDRTDAATAHAAGMA